LTSLHFSSLACPGLIWDFCETDEDENQDHETETETVEIVKRKEKTSIRKKDR
jgi:hypothetical protein